MGTNGSTELLYDVRNRMLAVFGLFFVVFFTVFSVREVAEGDGAAAAILAFFAVAGAAFVVIGINFRLKIYTDRFESSTWSQRHVVVPFTEITEATLREGTSGPRLHLRTRDGKTYSWKSRAKGRSVTEPLIKVMHDALIAAGVAIDSQNWAGTAPFTAWMHVAPLSRQPDQPHQPHDTPLQNVTNRGNPRNSADR